MTEKALYKRYSRVGPGGMKCTCCGPAPGKKRKWHMRYWKRQYTREQIRQVMQEFEDNQQE